MKVSLKWLKDFVKVPAPFLKAADRLTMTGLEVEEIREIKEFGGDTVFDVEVTTNRPDWLSQWGVAREIAAVEGLKLKEPEWVDEASLGRSNPGGWKIQIKHQDACPYYSGILIEGIQHEKTPDFIVERLGACGVRSIGLIVDITNYVMLELGQPMHAFDADLLRGAEINIRKAKKGEKLTMINEDILELKVDDLVIADKERPVALAGIMGGLDSEISDRTRNIFLESAYFNPLDVRQSSRVHNIFSDSSYRFERKVDPLVVDLARQRAVYLIQKYAKPRFVGGVLKMGNLPLKENTIHLRQDQITKVLGCEIKSSEVTSVLNRLGLDVSTVSNSSWKVKIPSYRMYDLLRPIDLIEEIARIWGFEKIEGVLPAMKPLNVSENLDRKFERVCRDVLVGQGYFETVTFSLISDLGLSEAALKNAVKIRNPQQKGLHWMRPTLITSLLQVVERNKNLGVSTVPIFEIANIYSQESEKKHPEEYQSFGVALSGAFLEESWQDSSRPFSYFDLKGVLCNLFEALKIENVIFEPVKHEFFDSASEVVKVGDQVVGFLGGVSAVMRKAFNLKEDVFYSELNLQLLKPLAFGQRAFQVPSKFPSIKRDLSITVDDGVRSLDLESDIYDFGGRVVKNVHLFDFYRGKRVQKGCKNLAFQVTYRSDEETLVSDEIQKLHEEIAKRLVKKYEVSFQA